MIVGLELERPPDQPLGPGEVAASRNHSAGEVAERGSEPGIDLDGALERLDGGVAS